MNRSMPPWFHHSFGSMVLQPEQEQSLGECFYLRVFQSDVHPIEPHSILPSSHTSDRQSVGSDAVSL